MDEEVVEELTGSDYVLMPTIDIVKHPDFSPQAHQAVIAVCRMTSAQLEDLNIEGKD